MPVRVTVNTTAIEELVHGPVRSKILGVANATASNARTRAPSDTGRMKGMINVREAHDHGAWMLIFHIGPPGLKYAVWVHQGTGLYNKQDYIRPKSKPAMVFYWKKAGKVVSMQRVKGQPAQPFLLVALQRTSPWPVKVRHAPGRRSSL